MMSRVRLGVVLLALWAGGSWAQQAVLAGSWECMQQDSTGTANLRLELASDGEMRLALSADMSADQLGEGGFPASFAEGLVVKVTAGGTWTADADSLRFDITSSQVSFNGLSVADFMGALVDALVAQMVVESQIPADQVPAFTAMVREQLSAEMSSGALEQELTAGVNEGLIGIHAMAYRLENEAMVTADDTGDVFTWSRSAPSSAVDVTSWGQVKAGPR